MIYIPIRNPFQDPFPEPERGHIEHREVVKNQQPYLTLSFEAQRSAGGSSEGVRTESVAYKLQLSSCRNQLPLPPRLVRELLHRREEVLHHAARAEVDLGVDLHAGNETRLASQCLQSNRFSYPNHRPLSTYSVEKLVCVEKSAFPQKIDLSEWPRIDDCYSGNGPTTPNI